MLFSILGTLKESYSGTSNPLQTMSKLRINLTFSMEISLNITFKTSEAFLIKTVTQLYFI